MRIRLDGLDILFSRYIRTKAGWKCEYCGKQYQPQTAALQCSHFHGRRRRSTRWDPDNCAALCFYCHRVFTENPIQHVDWFKKRLGTKKFDALMLKSNFHSKPDKKILKMWLKQELERLEKNPADIS